MTLWYGRTGGVGGLQWAAKSLVVLAWNCGGFVPAKAGELVECIH